VANGRNAETKVAPPNLHKSLTQNVRLRLKQSHAYYRPGQANDKAKLENMCEPLQTVETEHFLNDLWNHNFAHQ
jgi:hypothetical protein